MKRHRYADEEPDFGDDDHVPEMSWAELYAGLCHHCGHSDHITADCLNVPGKYRTTASSDAAHLEEITS